jgi:hypothetical protein
MRCEHSVASEFMLPDGELLNDGLSQQQCGDLQI